MTVLDRRLALMMVVAQWAARLKRVVAKLPLRMEEQRPMLLKLVASK